MVWQKGKRTTRMHHWYLAAMLAAALTFVASLSGIAYASWQVDDDTNTQVSTTSLAIDLITDTSINQPQYPGADITRSIAVKNTGADGVFVRIKLVGDFVDEQGDSVEDTAHLIEITYDTTFWKDGQDGYYYLRGVLEPGATSASCVSSITLSTDIPASLAGYTALVTPQAEALQIPANAVEATWDKTYEFMEAKQREPREAGQAHISFVDPTTGFVFIPTNKDLFPGAKSLAPGEKVTHSVTFSNAYTDPVSIDISSGGFAPSNETELFSKHATMTIVDEGGATLFSGPAAGPEWDAFVHTISLAPNASETWEATLVVSPEAGNELQGINTQILSWELSARASDEPPAPNPSPSPTATPKTGENPLMLLCALIACISGLSFIILAVRYRKQGRSDTYE